MDSDIYRFYTGKIPANYKAGYFLKDILNWSDYQLEVAHDFIQWLFPDETGGMNSKAPKLNDKDLQALKESKEVRKEIVKSTLRMLNFYGFKVFINEEGEISLAQIKPLYRKENGKTVGLFSEHNYLRITRMIKFLRLMDMQYLSSLVMYMCCLALNDKDLKYKILNSFGYWKNAYKTKRVKPLKESVSKVEPSGYSEIVSTLNSEKLKSSYTEMRNRLLSKDSNWKSCILLESIDTNILNEVYSVSIIADFPKKVIPSNNLKVNFNKGFYPLKHSDNVYEYWYVDFANRHLGGGVFSGGFVQEEVLFCKFPQTLALVFDKKPIIPQKGAICIYNLRQGINFPDRWYSSRYMHQNFGFEESCEKLKKDIRILNYTTQRCGFICLDAIDHSDDGPNFKYSDSELSMLLNKAYSGFLYAALKCKAYTPEIPVNISTGMWGSGVFNNNPVVMLSIQIQAAYAVSSVHPVNLNFWGVPDRVRDEIKMKNI